MRLSRDFTSEELTATNTGLSNMPGHTELEKLLYLANYILQPVRDRWGPLIVTSGYRSAAVNVRVGGSPSSQHLLGEAADLVPVSAGIDMVYRWLVLESGLSFAQAINEQKGKRRWIHVSLARLGHENNEVLEYDGDSYRRFKS